MTEAGTRGRNDLDAAEAQLELDCRALELHSQGMTWKEVGEAMGCSHSTAWDRAQRAQAGMPDESAAVFKAVQVMSLLRQKRVVLGVMADPGYKVDHGKMVMDPSDGSPMKDKKLQLEASAELRRIEDLLSRLVGTRAPTVHEVHEITEDALDAELKRLSQKLGRQLPGSDAGQLDHALSAGED